jgi:rod shape-determining protein MreC
MKRKENILAIIGFIVAAVLILLLSPRNRERVQTGFLNLISPFLRKGSELDTSWKTYTSRVKKLSELEEENARLKTEVEQYRAENQALRGVEAEKLRLEKSIGFNEQSSFTLVPARVIGRSVSNWWSTIKVNKGSADGIVSEMPVLTADGLVGKVTNVSQNMSTVLLITDENCKVAATVESTKEQGIVRVEIRGERTSTNLQPRITLNFVSKIAALQEGQRVVTSGAGQVYPPGITVGKIVEFKQRELDGQAVVEPLVDLATLSDVFIVNGIKANVQLKQP